MTTRGPGWIWLNGSDWIQCLSAAPSSEILKQRENTGSEIHLKAQERKKIWERNTHIDGSVSGLICFCPLEPYSCVRKYAQPFWSDLEFGANG